MDANSSTSNSSRLPVAAIAAAAIIIVAEIIVAASAPTYLDAFFNTLRHKKNIAFDSQTSEQAVIVGDSNHLHLRPAAVGRALGGMEVTNYAWPYCGVEAYDLFLEAYLEHNEPPQLIIAGFTIPNTAMAPGKTLVQTGEDPLLRTRLYNLVPAKTIVTRFATEGHWNIIGDYAAYLCSPPSMKYRSSILNYLIDYKLMRDPEAVFMHDTDRWRERQYEETGAFYVFQGPIDPAAYESLVQAASKEYGPWDADFDPRAELWYRRFLERARDHNIPVVIYNPPIAEALYDYLDAADIVAAHTELLRTLDRDYENVRVAEPPVFSEENTQFGDLTHLHLGADPKVQPQYLHAITSNYDF